jgi:hypothetical protein
METCPFFTSKWKTPALPKTRYQTPGWARMAQTGGGKGIDERGMAAMYQFSRSIYRELAPRAIEGTPGGPSPRQELLEACEQTIWRLASDRRYFARPARSLFSRIRIHFPISDQLYVYKVVERHVSLAVEFIDALPPDVCLDGVPRQCRASTRKGTPCQRDPLPGMDYCPSHQHLEEPAELTPVAA